MGMPGKLGFKIMTLKEFEMLDHSNRIENERSQEALQDAVEAWNYQKDIPITLKSILETHRLLLQRLRPNIAGKLRDCDVYIGGFKKHFISQTLLADNISSLCKELKINDRQGADKQAKNCHIVFEDIHPFEDGNGRVGRIVYNVHRLNLGLPIHVIHEGREQRKYYKWFTERIM